MEYLLMNGFEYLARGARPALFLYTGVVLIRWARGREITFEPAMIWEFLFIWWLATLMRAMGLDGMDGGWHWSIFHPMRFTVGFYGEGSIRSLLLAVLMYAPCGFLTPYVFRGITWDMTRTLAIGVLISFLIEVLVTPLGGSVALGGLIESAVGTAAGYLTHGLFETFGHSLKAVNER